MFRFEVTGLLLIALSAFIWTGCESLPGSKGTQGAVIGGAGGAAVGAAVGGEQHRLLGALIGGAIGTAGGYVVGANSDRILGRDQNGAQEATRQSQDNPATPQDALQSATADINGNGFVTMDEVVAMKDAGLTDAQMLERMAATGQVFELTPEQRQSLLSRGVSSFVVDQMETLNRATRDRLMRTSSSGPTGTPPVLTPRVNEPPLNRPPEMAPPIGGQLPTVPR
jgi:hypothetical protein